MQTTYTPSRATWVRVGPYADRDAINYQLAMLEARPFGEPLVAAGVIHECGPHCAEGCKPYDYIVTVGKP